MYGIALYKPGEPLITVGGEMDSLSSVLRKLDSLRIVLGATESEGAVGIRININGSPCELLVVDRYGFPIKDANTE